MGDERSEVAIIGPGDPDMPPHGTPTMCCRVADLPEASVPSDRRACYTCGAECWISRSAVPLCDFLGGRVQCTWCITGEGCHA